MIDDATLRKSVQRRAWDVASNAFSVDAWRTKWLTIIDEVIIGRNEAAAAMERAGVLAR